MKKYWLYITILVLLFVAVVYFNYTAPKELDWRPTFAKSDKIPYGTYILFEQLPKAFPGQQIETVNDPLYTLLDNEFENSNLVIVNNTFEPDKYETEKLLEYVEIGNRVFIAAETFSEPLADTLGIKTTPYFENVLSEISQKDSVAVCLNDEPLSNDYKLISTAAAWSIDLDSAKRDSLGTKILGTYYRKHPNFVRIPFGEGYFYINTTPKAFTNYILRDSLNWSYAFKCFIYMPLQDVLWDEYYKGNQIQRSELSFILSQKPLRWAYYILIVTLVLYILFEGKRRQKIIPVIEPLKNTTVEFVDTVGRLYFQNRDHKNLAIKKINHFHDFLHQKLYIKPGPVTDEYLKQVQLKSGLTSEQTTKLFAKIERAYHSPNYTENDLKLLNKAIDDFYKLF